MRRLNELTLAKAARGLRAKEFSVRELWEACASAAHEKNSELNAYLEIFAADEAAIEAAQARIDQEGEAAPMLAGIPLAIKDNILIEGKIASAASKMLEQYRATYDATVITKLKEAGALFVGRTNMDEFALGGSTENSAFGVTKNPHDPSRVAGGTSGGSAAAVAAHLCIAALGTDTGGSVRNPASHCGVVGMKPTYGGISRSGVIAAASSFDQVGPITKTVEDAQILFEAMHGRDPLDATTIPADLYAVRTLGEKLRIGDLRASLSAEGTHPAITQAFDQVMDALQKAGHELVPITIPTLAPSLASYYIINFAEVSANLARYDGIRYGHAERTETLLGDYVRSRTLGFGPETRRRILLGTYVLSAGYIDAYYNKANAVRTLLRRDFNAAFEKVDVIMTPTMPAPAFRIGEKSDPLALYLEDAFTVPANLTGMPALSLPMGVLGALPIGLHITAPAGADESLFMAAQKVEEVLAEGSSGGAQ